MKKNFFKTICVMMVVAMVGVMMVGCGKKKYDFTDDIVIIVLTREASILFHRYVPEDFSEVEISEVKDLSGVEDMEERFRKLHAGELPWDYGNTHIYNTYKAMLSLKLKYPSHKNVLTAIKLLEKRSDVEHASPNSIVTGAA